MKRQGDLLFERIEQLPTNRLVEDKIIARGETTGHAHVLEGDTAVLRRSAASLLIDAPDGGAVVHDEHDRIELEPGIWMVHVQQEYVSPTETTAVYD